MARAPHENFLMTAEHIGGGVPMTPEELETPAWQGYDILTHTPAERKWTDALHARGIRSMPYLTLTYQYMDRPAGLDAAGETPEAVAEVGKFAAGWDAGQTPDVIIIDQLGRPQLHENYRRHDGKLIYEICPNTRKARDLYLKLAERLMEAGVDGLFLDNAAAARRCWGPDFGRHAHLHAGDPMARAEGRLGFCYPKAARKYRLEVPIADDEQTYATAMLIREIRELVRSYGPDKRVMLNGGEGSGLPPIFFDHADSVMNEMFIYATYLDFNFPAPTHLDYMDHTPLDWLNALAWEDRFTDRVRMNCLSAFSAHDPDRRCHAVFAFCAAKLWDALVYTTADLALDAWLRGIRLGRPLGDRPGAWGAVFYREYEGGLVVCNPYGVAQQATVPWTGKPAEIVAHGDVKSLSSGPLVPVDGTVTLKLNPDSAGILLPAGGA